MVAGVNARQIAALLSAVAGTAIILAGLVGPARAAEERLHRSAIKVHGLILPGEGDKSDSHGGSFPTASADGGKMKSGSKRGAGRDGNEPRIEDPPLPPYDGAAGGQGNTAD